MNNNHKKVTKLYFGFKYNKCRKFKLFVDRFYLKSLHLRYTIIAQLIQKNYNNQKLIKSRNYIIYSINITQNCMEEICYQK